MADKGFGVKEINLIGASGTPTIESPNNLNLNAVNVAISTDTSIGGQVGIADTIFHIGDTNTKIRFPAADVISFERGGGEALRITTANALLTAGVTAEPLYPHYTTARKIQAEIKGAIDTGQTRHHGSLAVNCTNSNSFIGLVRSDNTQTDGTDIGVIGWTGFDGTDFHQAAAIMVKKGAGAGNDDQPGHMIFKTNSGTTSATERLRIKSGGTVAIPAQGSSNANPRLLFESAVDANDFSFSQYEDGNGTYTMIGQNLQLSSGGNTTILDSGHRTAGIMFDGRNNGALMFYTGNTNAQDERLRITSTGQASLGSATVSGYNDRMLTLYNSSTCYLEVRTDAGDNNSGIIFSKGSAQDSDSYRGYIAYNHSTDRMTFHTGGGTRRGMFDANGLHFDTNNNSAETGLDDYEEGSFTLAATSNATMTSSSGTYTKIGRLVHVKFSFQINQINSGSTTHVTGLPFSAAQQGYGQHGYFASIGNFNSLSPYATGTTVYFNVINTNNSFAQNPSILGNSSRVDGSITYTTN